MSNHDNHRRGERKRTEHGPRWEGGGSDNSGVARARQGWKRIKNRAFRRTLRAPPAFRFGIKPGRPPSVAVDELEPDDSAG